MPSKAEADLAAYIEDDAERWFAVHERIKGTKLVCLTIVSALEEAAQAVIIRRLRQASEVMHREGDHPATVGEIDAMLEALGPKKDASPSGRGMH